MLFCISTVVRTFFRLPEDGSGLELRQADQHPAQPPALVVRAQAVQEGEAVGGQMEDGEEDDGSQRHRHRLGEQEHQAEDEQVWSLSSLKVTRQVFRKTRIMSRLFPYS